MDEAENIQPAVFEEVKETWEVQISANWSGKLIEALAKAQLKFKPVLKQVDNAAFMRGGKASKYADLAEYIDATQQALAENGLVVTQWPDVSPEAKSMSLISYLMHSSGEWMRGKLTLPATNREGFTPQSCGMAITYARRYSYAAITGCASEDDDGNLASGVGTKEAAREVATGKVKEALKSPDPKIRDLATKANEQLNPTALFYCMPTEHNGHFAEFVNIKDYLASHKADEDLIRYQFTAHNAKKTKHETALVPAEKLQPLLEQLVGDMGITVKELGAAK